MRIDVRSTLPLLCALFLGACVSKSEGARLSRELADARTRLEALERQNAEQRTSFEQSVTTLRDDLAQLHQRLDATGRGSADIGADVGSLRELVQQMDGRMAELQQALASNQTQLREQSAQLDQQIERLARKAGVDISLRDSDIPQDKAAHFTAAYQAYQQADHSRARALFTEYVRRYPQDDNADNAQYWIGKSYLDQQQPARAIGAFREVITRFQNGDALERSLFDMSQSFYDLHSCSDAKTALETLIQVRPQSSLLRDAQRRLRELRSPPRGYCTN
jgi:TolA-binding protein